MILVENISKTYKVQQRGGLLKDAVSVFFSHEYKKIMALDDIGFSIEQGELVGYIGPNGAGKSSTIKILSGILTPDSGNCVVNGMIPWKQREKYVKNIGVIFGQRTQLWWDLPVIDSFNILADIYDIPTDIFKKNIRFFQKELDLDEIIKTPVRQLSLGQRMRCEVTASLLHDPNILFLDEPTIGLDATSKKRIRDFIKTINKQEGTTIILTTHDMYDVDELSNRTILIGKGKILYDGNMEKIKKKYDRHYIKFSYSGSMPIINFSDDVTIDYLKNNTAHVVFNPEKIDAYSVVTLLMKYPSVHLSDITVYNQKLDDIIIDFYNDYNL